MRWRDGGPERLPHEYRDPACTLQIGEDEHTEIRFAGLLLWAFDGKWDNFCLRKVAVANTGFESVSEDTHVVYMGKVGKDHDRGFAGRI